MAHELASSSRPRFARQQVSASSMTSPRPERITTLCWSLNRHESTYWILETAEARGGPRVSRLPPTQERHAALPHDLLLPACPSRAPTLAVMRVARRGRSPSQRLPNGVSRPGAILRTALPQRRESAVSSAYTRKGAPRAKPLMIPTSATWPKPASVSAWTMNPTSGVMCWWTSAP